MRQVFVLDACALIAYLSDEQGAEVVGHYLQQADKGLVSIVINKINLLEVYYGLYRDCGKEFADKIFFEITQSNIEIIETITDPVFFEAGRLKSTYKISLADSIVLAETAVRKATILTSDHHEFDAVEQQEPIAFKWIR